MSAVRVRLAPSKKLLEKYVFCFGILFELMLYFRIESQLTNIRILKEVAYGITMVPCTHGCIK